MKKKTIAVCCMASALMAVSGCGNAIPDMSEEQGAIVAEYAAGLLLKYDKNYTTRLVEEEAAASEEPEEEAEEKTEEKEPSGQEAAEPEKDSVSENEIADEKDGISGDRKSVV